MDHSADQNITLKASNKSILRADVHESDFNSCAQSFGEASDSSDEDAASPKIDGVGGSKTVNERKRDKRNRRKLASTPDKEQFLKKLDTKLSPK